MKFECLAHWRGLDDETYVVFTDSRHLTNLRPKYRCAVSNLTKTGNFKKNRNFFNF